MRQQCFCSLVLATLLLAPFLIAAPEALRAHAHEGVIYTSDQTWSGNLSLDEDVVIDTGATLVIQSGTQINVTEDITITIRGALQIQGTPEAPVDIWGSWVAETSVQARWQGFLLTSGSISTVAHAMVSDSRGGFDVEQGATLTIESTHFTDSIIGVWNKGSITGSGFECLSATTSCLRVDGTANLDTISSTTSAGVVHVYNGGDASIDTIDSNQDSDVLILDGGSTYSGEIHAGGFTRMIRASGSVSATVTPVVTTAGDTLVDASSLSGLIVTNGQTNGSVSSLLIGSVSDIEFDSVEYACDGTSNCIDAQVNGELTLSNSNFGLSASESVAFARFRGAGNVLMDNVNVSASTTFFDIAGDGELSIEGSSLSGQSLGTISGWQLQMNNTSAIGEEDGLVLLDVESTLIETEFSRTFAISDSTSTGLRVVWSEVNMQDVTMSGWNDGIRCESECIITGTTVNSGGGGRNSGSGLTIDGGSIGIQTVLTSTSDVGIDLIQGDVHIEEWTVEMVHRTYGIQLANDAHATIRNMPSYTSNGVHDGFGDGTLLWGSTGAPDLAVSIEESFTESTITVTDLGGQFIAGASVTSHGFTETTDVAGQASLPLLSAGSHVQAHDPSSGMGSSATVSPPGGEVQIAVVPSTGDWTIPSGVHATLTGDFPLNGNLTIESTASLTLVDSTLSMPTDATLTIQPNGLLKGDNGTLHGGIASLTAGVPLRGEEGGLTLITDVTFTCYDPWTWVNTSITGSLHLNYDCELILDGGVAGTVTVDEDASLVQRSHLSVTVLDVGEPAENATVSIGGWVQDTNSNGKAETWFTWRTVDESGETTPENPSQTVIIDHGSIYRYNSWNPALGNAEIEVMISTIKEDSITESLRLESVFSPWHLGHDLLVSSGATLEVMPDAELSLALDIGIEIEGDVIAEDARVGGYGSAGVTVEANGNLQMSSTSYWGGPILVEAAGTASLSSMDISYAPLTVSSNGIMEIIGGAISQTDICIRATGTLNMHGTTIEGCEMYALWTTGASLWIEDLNIGIGNSNGAWIQQSSGTLSGWDTTNFDGDGAALFLQMVDGSLSVSNMELSTGQGESALRIEQAEEFEMSDSTISGSPGMFIQESEMRLTRVDLTGTGTGDGITIHGTPSGGTIIDDCDVDGYATALRLGGGVEEVEGVGVTILNSHLHAETSIASVTLPFTVKGGELDGTIHMDGLDKPWSATLIDHDDIETNIIGDATLYIAHTWTVVSPQGTIVSITIPEFDFTLGEQQFEWTNPTQIEIVHQAHTDSGMTDALYAHWVASSEGYLPSTGQLQLDTTGQRILNIELTVNAAPVVTIETPQPMEINAGQVLNYSATASDPNGDEIIEWVWVFESADYTILVGDTASGTTSDTEQGEWLLRATAIDTHGAEGTATVAITVNAADADNDYIESCPSTGPNAWWDALNNRFCGPDVFDVDDDNDNFRDEADLFPYDPCAHHDTDNDGLPNSIANNCDTDLVEDDDDDGDGVIDSEDLDPLDPSVGVFSDSGGDKSLIATLCSPTVVLSLALLIVFSTFAYLRYNTEMKREE